MKQQKLESTKQVTYKCSPTNGGDINCTHLAMKLVLSKKPSYTSYLIVKYIHNLNFNLLNPAINIICDSYSFLFVYKKGVN